MSISRLLSSKFISLTAVAFLSLSLTACKKWIELKPSPVQIEDKIVFADDQSATSAVMGLYSQMTQSSLIMTNGGLSVYTGLSSDEIYTSASSSLTDPFLNNNLLATNSAVNVNFWRSAYINLYHTNSIIEGLTSSQTLSSAVKNQLLGEMKFVRAFYFFYMVNLFGDVPLVITTNYKINGIMPRTATTVVYEQIISDLLEAKELMGAGYPSANRLRPNKYSASALLARVYLFRQNWIQAEALASDIINAGLYQLTADPNNTFLSGSQEIIWQIAKENNNTAEGVAFIPASATVKPTYAITSQLLNAFESNDTRKAKWLKANTVSAQLYYYPFKYKSRTATPLTENLVALRLAEQYLVRAEARAYLNNLDSARTDINRIRTRAGLPGVIATTQAALLSAINKERQTELFCEWGHRWIDLKRTGMADMILGAVKPGWQSYAALYPVPANELELNAFLVQNPGY